MNGSSSADITILLSRNVVGILGLDDACRMPNIERISVGKSMIFRGERAALVMLANEISDRATEGDDGYNHSSRDKAILRRALVRMAAHGIKAESVSISAEKSGAL